MLVCPESYIRDGACKLMSGTELKDIAKASNKPMLMKAEDSFTRAAEWLSQIPNITNAKANKLRSDYE
eukprot:5763680-Pyramimonas_sp.AAC.1